MKALQLPAFLCLQYSLISFLAVGSKKIGKVVTRALGHYPQHTGITNQLETSLLELEASALWGSASGRAEAGAAHAQLINCKCLV